MPRGLHGFGSGLAWMAAGNWVEQAVNFAVFVLLARILGVEAFGLLAMAGAFVVLAEFLVRHSLSEVLIAAAEGDGDDADAVFWLLAALGCGLALILWVAAGPIAALYGEPQVQGLVAALAFTVPAIALTAVPVALLRREMRFRALSLRAIAGVLAGGAVGIGLALSGAGVWSLAGQRLVQVLVNVALAWVAVPWRPRLAPGRAALRRVLAFGGSVLALRAGELAARQAPVVIIGATLGAVPLGLFSIAWRVVEIATFLIVSPLWMTAQPAFAAAGRQGGGAPAMLLELTRLTGPVVFPAFLGLAVVADPLLHVLFGPEWTGAAPLLAILVVMGCYSCIERLQQAYCLAAGRAGALAGLALAEAALVSVLVLAAAPAGLAPATAAFVAGFLLLWPIRFVVVARLAGVAVGQLAAPHLRPALAALAMALALTPLVERVRPVSEGLALLSATAAGIAMMAALALLFMRDRVRLLIGRLGGRGDQFRA